MSAPSSALVVVIVGATDAPTTSALAGHVAAAGFTGIVVDGPSALAAAGAAVALIDLAVHRDPLVLAVQLWRATPDLPVAIVGDDASEEVAQAAQEAGIFAVLPLAAPGDLGAALRMLFARAQAGRPEFTRALARTLCAISSLASDAVDTTFVTPALERVASLFAAEQASILLFDDPTRDDAVLTMAAQVGLPPGVVARTQVRRGEGVAGRVAASGVPQVLLRDLERNPGFADLPARAAGVTASICVPIRAPGEAGSKTAIVLGVLSVARKRAGAVFTPCDLDVCDSIAAHLGEALARVAGERRSRDLQERMAAVEKLSYAGELAAGIAHEIASPVACLRTNLEALHEYVIDLDPALQAIRAAVAGDAAAARALNGRDDLVALLDDIPALLADCRAGVQRTFDIVSETKSLVRLDGETGKPAGGLVPAAGLIQETLRLLRPRLQNRARVQVQADADAVIHGRSVELGQILVNLIVNAVDACDERKLIEARGESATNYEPEVRIVARLDKGLCVVTVADNGVGIPEGQLRRIFAPLFTTKAPGVGTGLGLGIVRRIVDAHRGQLVVTSTVGEGTQFTVSLPSSDAYGVRPFVGEVDSGEHPVAQAQTNQPTL